MNLVLILAIFGSFCILAIAIVLFMELWRAISDWFATAKEAKQVPDSASLGLADLYDRVSTLEGAEKRRMESMREKMGKGLGG